MTRLRSFMYIRKNNGPNTVSIRRKIKSNGRYVILRDTKSNSRYV